MPVFTVEEVVALAERAIKSRPSAPVNHRYRHRQCTLGLEGGTWYILLEEYQKYPTSEGRNRVSRQLVRSGDAARLFESMLNKHRVPRENAILSVPSGEVANG